MLFAGLLLLKHLSSVGTAASSAGSRRHEKSSRACPSADRDRRAAPNRPAERGHARGVASCTSSDGLVFCAGPGSLKE